MFREFFVFDLKVQARAPVLWLAMAFFGLLAFGAASSDAVIIGGAVGNVHRNAPAVTLQFLPIFTLFGIFFSGSFVGGSVVRDFELGTAELFFASPASIRALLLGRFAAGVVVSSSIYVVALLAMLPGVYAPWVDARQLGPFTLAPFVYGLFVIVLPTVVTTSALTLFFGALTRSMFGVYAGLLLFFIAYIVAIQATRDLDSRWAAVLTDPTASAALQQATRYWTTDELNARLPGLDAFVVANRALWLVVAAGLIGATTVLFRARRAGTARAWWPTRAKKATTTATTATTATTSGPLPSASLPPQAPARVTATTSWRQLLRQVRFDVRWALWTPSFVVLLAFGLLTLTGGLSFHAPMYDTPLYPTTSRMITAIEVSYAWLVTLIVVFLAGELHWRERTVKLDGVVDAFPVPDWVPVVARAVTVVAVTVVYLAIGGAWCVLDQLVDGFTDLEPRLYLQGLLLQAPSYVLMGWLTLAAQALTGNKFTGYLVVILVIVAGGLVEPLHFDHHLASFASAPVPRWSDMNGWGGQVTGWAWFTGFWALFTLTLLIASAAFAGRGVDEPFGQRLRSARSRLRGAVGVAVGAGALATAGVGAVIVHNTTTLNRYVASDVALDERAAYERTWRPTEHQPQPRITATDSTVVIDPSAQSVRIDGWYRLKNKTTAPIATLQLWNDPELDAVTLTAPGATLTTHDVRGGVRVLTLATPLAPGDELELRFHVADARRGFTNEGGPGRVRDNGTFFDNTALFPQLGYQRGLELEERSERRKRGLGEPRRMPALATGSRDANYISDDADWIEFATTVCTSPDQVALAPGTLQREWSDQGRRCFRYAAPAPIVAFWSYLSGRWQVKRAAWGDVALEVWFHPAHGWNVDRMLQAMQTSLTTYTAAFGPYQHRELRIIEFPGYASFAQAFANTVPFSESIGFVTNVEAEGAVDYVTYVTAHEVAHQWWAHQVIGADVQGATLLSETLAQYAAMLVMEQSVGPTGVDKFMRYELDSYLFGRGQELVAEEPLVQVEASQSYVHYAKGSLAMARLKDAVGADVVNLGLRNFLARWRFAGPPYPTSLDLIDALRAAVPPEQHGLLVELFERIGVYDLRVEQATAQKRADGRYDVTIAWRAGHDQVDGTGKTTAIALDDDIDLGVFAAPVGSDAPAPLLLQKQHITGTGGRFTVTVTGEPYEAGIDPLHRIVDRDAADNRQQVTLEP
jgi:ABC-type transport system involved in multi-copper enzyme maturation permease subunit